MAYAIDQVEGDTTQGSSPVTIVTIGSASLPSSPIFPDTSTALIVGGLIGFGFGVAFALTRTASDRRIRAADDVEQKTGVPLVGAIPATEGMEGDNRLIGESTSKGKGKGSNFAVSEAMRSLRTNLQFMDVDNPPRTIVVTSPLPGDGKSTIACNLAITLAVSGQPVVLVDGDLRRSAVAKTMGLPGGAGLTDVLSGRADLSDVLQRTPRAKNLYVLAAGSVPPNPSEVLGSERMRSLLVDLASHAVVIIDAPPLLPVTDGAVLTHQADGALLVVGIGKTTYDLVEKALDTLQKASGRALGIVLNRVPTRGVDASPYSYEYRREYGTPKLDEESASPATGGTDSFDLEAIFGATATRDVEVRRQRARRN
ncbi:polysaccharide biosynthesis tyrosine autokinase [Microbacterium awajiense]